MSEGPVLLVDGDPVDAAATRSTIADHPMGGSIIEVVDGEAALAALHPGEGSPPPALVLLATQLPGMDGWRVLETIRADERTAEIPVVMLHPFPGSEERLRAEQLRAQAVIGKPVDFAEFHDAVCSLGLLWHLHRVPAPLEHGSRRRTRPILLDHHD
jgi:two-component system, response regulator